MNSFVLDQLFINGKNTTCHVSYFQPVTWPANGLTEIVVIAHCRLKIAGSVVGLVCGRLLGITFEREILGCIEDVKVGRLTNYKVLHIDLKLCILVFL